MVWVAVMDGTVLGHLRCSIHNCQNRLTVSRDRFCPEHRHMNSICAIKGCEHHRNWNAHLSGSSPSRYWEYSYHQRPVSVSASRETQKSRCISPCLWRRKRRGFKWSAKQSLRRWHWRARIRSFRPKYHPWSSRGHIRPSRSIAWTSTCAKKEDHRTIWPETHT